MASGQSCVENVLANDPEVKALQEDIDRLSDRSKRLKELRETSLANRLHEASYQVWVNGRLSNPFTHLKNMVSNAAFIGTRPLEAFANATMSKVTPGRSEITYTEGVAEALGLMQGTKDAFKLMGSFMKAPDEIQQALSKAGYDPELAVGTKLGEETNVITADMFGAQDKWFGKAIDIVGKFTQLPGHALTAADIFAKVINARGQALKLATREALSRKANGEDISIRSFVKEKLDTPDSDFQRAVVQDAEERTFTSNPGQVFHKIDEGIKATKVLPWIVPFRRTITNIFLETMKRNPTGLMLPSVRKAIFAGGASRDEALGRMSLGIMAGAGMLVALDDHIIGGAPKSRFQKAIWEREGNKAYTFKVGNTLIPFQELGPLGAVFKILTDYRELQSRVDYDDDEDQRTSVDLAMDFTAPFINHAIDSTWMSNIGQAMTALESLADTDSTTKTQAKIWLDQFAGSWVPAFVSQAAKMYDPEVKDIRGAEQAIFARLPVYSSKLTTLHDIFGDPIHHDNWQGVGFLNAANSYNTKSKAAAEINRLEIKLRPLSRKITVAGRRFTLTQEERQKMSVLAGKGDGSGYTLDEAITMKMQTEHYQNLKTDEARRKVLRSIIDGYRAQAKGLLAKQSPEFKQRLKGFAETAKQRITGE